MNPTSIGLAGPRADLGTPRTGAYEPLLAGKESSIIIALGLRIAVMASYLPS
jgi:hypothetical protein